MSFFYSIGEGFRAFRKARFAALLSGLSIASALFFLGLFGTFVLQGWRIVENLKDQIAMEVFLKDVLPDDMAQSLRQRFLSHPEVDSLVFVSKEQALAEFKKEMGQDVLDLIGENPLPASYRIYFKAEYHKSDQIKKFQKEIESWPGVDEVVYRYDLLNLLVRYVRIALLVMVLIGAVLIVLSTLLIANTVRHSIDRNRHAIHIMSLVGATPGFIRRPYVVEGILQGALGALLAVLLLYGFFVLLRFFFPDTQFENWPLFAGLLIWGVLIGGLGAILGIRRHLRF